MTGRFVHGRPDTVTVSLIVVSVIACASILAREATYGIGLATDTIYYIDTARNILAGNGFAMTWGGDYVHWPPLYPMLLAGAGLSLFDPYDIAGPFNAIVLALIVFSVGMHMRNRVESGFLAVWFALSIALSTTLAKSTSYCAVGACVHTVYGRFPSCNSRNSSIRTGGEALSGRRRSPRPHAPRAISA